jgi:hypothetical protein
MTNVPDIDALAGMLTLAMPRLSASEQRLALTLIRQLALGAPVGVSRLASAAELSEAQITNGLDHLPGVFRDEGQRVVAFMGLTVVEMGHHRIHVEGRPLSAWCAWDTLFLPELLGKTAYVTSRSPTSDAEISLTVTPTGPTDLHRQTRSSRSSSPRPSSIRTSSSASATSFTSSRRPRTARSGP